MFALQHMEMIDTGIHLKGESHWMAASHFEGLFFDPHYIPSHTGSLVQNLWKPLDRLRAGLPNFQKAQ